MARMSQAWEKPKGFQIIAHERTLFKVLDLLQTLPRGKVLDIPSGEGGLSHCMQNMGFQVVAGDLDPGFFKATGIDCFRIDMNRPLGLEDASFDYVICLEGIEHLEHPFQFIRECNRILKWQGKLILSTPNILNLTSRLKYLLSGFYSLCSHPLNEFVHTPIFDHINPMAYYQLRYALHTSGFQIVKTTTDLWRRSCWPLFVLYPFQKLYSIRTMRKESDPRQRKANREIRRVMHSIDLLAGRTLIIEASKTQTAGIEKINASQARSSE